MAASTTIDIIGWDEAKSRPIYRHIPKNSSATAPVVKNRVKINKSSSTTSNDMNIDISEELSPFNHSRVSTTKRGVSKTKQANNKKTRTISLSPQGEKKVIRWGDNTIREEADVDISFASTSTIITTTNNNVNKKRKKRGYGTKKSSFSTTSIALIDFGVNGGSTNNNYPPSTLSESNVTKIIDSPPAPEEEENNHRDIEEGDKCESGLDTEEEESIDDEKCGDGRDNSTKQFSQNSTSSDQFDFGGQDNNNDYLSDNEIDTEKKTSNEIDTEKKVNGTSNPNSLGNQNGNDLDVYEASSGNHSPEIDREDGEDSDVSEHESIISNHEFPGQIIPSSTSLTKDDNTPTTGQSKTSQNKEKEFSCDLDDTDTPMTRESVEINLTGGHPRRGDSDCSNDLDEFNFTLDDPESSSKKVFLPQKEKRQKRYGSTSKPLWMPHKSSNMDDVAAKNDDNNTSTKVGWDEEKERAILLPPKQKILPVQDNVKEAGANEDELIDAKRETTKNGNKTTKKRVYTTRFNKKTGLSQDYRDCHDIDSPSPVRDTSNTLPESTQNIACASKSVKPTGVKKISRVQKKKSMDIDSELDAIANDSNACRVQPTSKSSLANARAFFQHLDSNHNLTIANETVGSSTQHGVQKRSTQLEKEYVDYCESVILG